jgi:hypothetical protein
MTLHVGAQPPGRDLMANWLPAPSDDFSLFLRAYWPAPDILEGRWTPPPVERLGPLD